MGNCQTSFSNNVNQPTVGLQFNGLSETVRAVMERYGITLVSALEVKEYILNGNLAKVDVEGINLKNPISMCIRKEDVFSDPALQFVQIVLEDMKSSNPK
ncbi:hypothetical protein HOO54_12575 [Bacillus sp. WMMC1349]|uniref:LysR substrate-binding domain-containing protein n=1 Tax=Bacillus sp. WMMC1349 TaxID=2736254 RepID=UPI001554B813|nr:LysR substrate-binding domain-containing protein [Bacillus sp. WMMC1349]NPC93043.1 hypothetical protein [Bacillus sp. WMMC1349]